MVTLARYKEIYDALVAFRAQAENLRKILMMSEHVKELEAQASIAKGAVQFAVQAVLKQNPICWDSLISGVLGYMDDVTGPAACQIGDLIDHANLDLCDECNGPDNEDFHKKPVIH